MADNKYSIVVTSINAPNMALHEISKYSDKLGANFIIIGDTKSPVDFNMPGVNFLSFDAQQHLPFRFAKSCPPRHYARKNIGYLVAAQSGASVIVETDDDNIPVEGFDAKRDILVHGDAVLESGWANAYSYFSDSGIWPRGLPLTEILKKAPPLTLDQAMICPIQQGLADKNPDVDAIYRLVAPLPIDFDKRDPVILNKGVWCPFNSQNTTFFKDAFLLTYLPYHCSFRMTDIWRSFVAQRILWECDWNISFHSSTVYQDRNEHDLMKDFEDEISGYTGNNNIKLALESLNLKSGSENISENLFSCYEKLVSLDFIGRDELGLLSDWVADMETILKS